MVSTRVVYKELDCLVSAVRDSLFAFAENLIDDVQFAVLYDDNRSKPSFHTGRLIAFTLDNLDETDRPECRTRCCPFKSQFW